VGQVFELPDDPEILRRFDEYEGYDPSHPRVSLFVRRKWPVMLKEAGQKVTCWVYTYNRQPKKASKITVEDAPVALPGMTISESGYLPIPHKNKYGRDYGPAPDEGGVYPAVRK